MPQDGVAPDGIGWPAVASSWASRQDSAIYSLSFYAEPPDGMFVRTVSYAATVEQTCQVFASEQYLKASSERDDWVLLLQTSQSVAGEYRIRAADAVGGEPTAQVLVKHLVHGREVERHTGIGGTVAIRDVPGTTDAQKAGATFHVQGNVQFSDVEALQQGCSVGGAVDAAAPELTCTCGTSAGGTFTCPGVAEQASCCIDRSASRTSMAVDLVAAPCGDACLATDLTLTTYCLQLGNSGGTL